MLDILKALLKSISGACWTKPRAQAGPLDLLMIKGVTIYLKVVDAARKSALTMVWLAASLMMLIVGFIALHVGVFILAGWSLRTIGIITICLGGLYFVFFGILILSLTCERTWMKISKGSELVEKVTKNLNC